MEASIRVHLGNIGVSDPFHPAAICWIKRIGPLLTNLVDAKAIGLLRQLEEAISCFVAGRYGVKSFSSAELLALKGNLAAAGLGALDVPANRGGMGLSPVVQCLAQFTLGYYDTDFRDVAGAGHARLILTHGSLAQQGRWRQSILSGMLGGIAVTEPQGGSSLLNIRTTVRQARPDCWILSGEKSWISRIEEASVFVVFARVQPGGGLAAILIEPTRPGVKVERVEPSGLKGWSWGWMRFSEVLVSTGDFLATGEGALTAFHDHFAYYRPLAAATVLGTAASVCDLVASRLVEKDSAMRRDTAHKTLASHISAIQAAVLLVINASASTDAPQRLLGCVAKAHGADVALSAINDLALLLGAESFREASRINKAQRDVQAFQFADGANDALYRYAGRKFLELVAEGLGGYESESVPAATE